MKNRASLWSWVGAAVVSVLGTLFHFLYDFWPNAFTASFAAVNESTAEHLKLAFFPMLLFAAVQYAFFGKEREDFWCVKAKGIFLTLLLIPTLFYTLTGVFGTLPAAVDIALFYVSVGASFYGEARLFSAPPRPCRRGLALLLLGVTALGFVLFSFLPPRIGLFLDPVTKSYGR